MLISMIDPLGVTSAMWKPWTSLFDRVYTEPSHLDANYRVNVTTVEEAIFYSDATTPEAALLEATQAMNLYSNRVHKAQVSRDHVVVACRVDGDGYDTVTGLRANR